MYREPHLQKKSDECAKIWHEWFDQEYVVKDKETAKELRKKWSKCCSEFGKMVSHEVKTNPRYKGLSLDQRRLDN